MATLGSTATYLIRRIKGKCVDKLDAFVLKLPLCEKPFCITQYARAYREIEYCKKHKIGSRYQKALQKYRHAVEFRVTKCIQRGDKYVAQNFLEEACKLLKDINDVFYISAPLEYVKTDGANIFGKWTKFLENIRKLKPRHCESYYLQINTILKESDSEQMLEKEWTSFLRLIKDDKPHEQQLSNKNPKTYKVQKIKYADTENKTAEFA
jgi:hypothetical protein